MAVTCFVRSPIWADITLCMSDSCLVRSATWVASLTDSMGGERTSMLISLTWPDSVATSRLSFFKLAVLLSTRLVDWQDLCFESFHVEESSIVSSLSEWVFWVWDKEWSWSKTCLKLSAWDCSCFSILVIFVMTWGGGHSHNKKIKRVFWNKLFWFGKNV